jgi:hypothetical protein
VSLFWPLLLLRLGSSLSSSYSFSSVSEASGAFLGAWRHRRLGSSSAASSSSDLSSAGSGGSKQLEPFFLCVLLFLGCACGSCSPSSPSSSSCSVATGSGQLFMSGQLCMSGQSRSLLSASSRSSGQSLSPSLPCESVPLGLLPSSCSTDTTMTTAMGLGCCCVFQETRL